MIFTVFLNNEQEANWTLKKYSVLANLVLNIFARVFHTILWNFGSFLVRKLNIFYVSKWVSFNTLSDRYETCIITDSILKNNNESIQPLKRASYEVYYVQTIEVILALMSPQLRLFIFLVLHLMPKGWNLALGIPRDWSWSKNIIAQSCAILRISPQDCANMRKVAQYCIILCNFIFTSDFFFSTRGSARLELQVENFWNFVI